LKEYPLPMPDHIRRDATFNIVFTFRHVLEQEAKEGRFKSIDFDALTAKYRGEKPEEIPKIGQQYLSAIDEFLAIAPKDPQVPVLLFHAAAIYYVYGHVDEAEKRFFYIIDTYPETIAAVVAARLLVDDAIAQQNWTRVAELSKRFAEQNLGGQKSDFARIEGNARFKIAGKIFEEANELQKQNQLTLAKEKYKESARLFAELLAEDPTNPHADLMLWNSARAITQSGTLTQALPLYKRLYTEYPKSEYAKNARFQEALILEKMLKFSEAARAYDGIIKADPHSEAAADAMLNKALLYEAASENANAIAAFSAFAKDFPERPEAPDALLSAAGIYKKEGNITQQIAMLERFIKQYQKDKQKIPSIIEAHVHIAESYGDLAKSAAVAAKPRYLKLETEHYRHALALYSHELNSPLASFYAAKAQLFLDKPEQDSFKKMTIKARTGKAQAEELTAMLKKLAELAAKNEAVIRNFAQPVWNAEALYRIGNLYEHLSQAILKAPCPRDVAAIDEYACDEYIVLLEEKATVLENKSLDAYKQAYDIAMSAYDTPASLIDNIQAALNRLRPGKYQRVGAVIEKAKAGAFYGQGRMLSTGKMASSLHPNEVDPDIKSVIIKEPEQKAPEQEQKAPEQPEQKAPEQPIKEGQE
ncbi:MAG TPA: tetratricopeptide repeat protein, partial [Myxococcota bacterium]|nr:tetratricopeptide repeat protein [Myxococcota bacterium]